MCESEFLYFKVRLYITNQYWKIQKKFNYKINGLKKKGFQEGLQLQNGWFEKKIGTKGQQRLGQARPRREPNQAAPAQLAQVTDV